MRYEKVRAVASVDRPSMCAGKGEDYERGYSGDRDPALINAIESEERGGVRPAEKRPELVGARLEDQL